MGMIKRPLLDRKNVSFKDSWTRPLVEYVDHRLTIRVVVAASGLQDQCARRRSFRVSISRGSPYMAMSGIDCVNFLFPLQ